MGGSRSHSDKKLENRPQKLLRINTFCDSMPVCILFVCTLFIFSHYDLSVLSMSVMGFQKKSAKRVGVWCELYPVFVLIVLLCKVLRHIVSHCFPLLMQRRLPVEYHIKFKITNLTYNCVHLHHINHPPCLVSCIYGTSQDNSDHLRHCNYLFLEPD